MADIGNLFRRLDELKTYQFPESDDVYVSKNEVLAMICNAEMDDLNREKSRLMVEIGIQKQFEELNKQQGW